MAHLESAFGRAIRKQRESLEISQEALAFRAGIHRTYISQLERGIKSPSLKVIQMIAKALDINMSDLIAETEKQLSHVE